MPSPAVPGHTRATSFSEADREALNIVVMGMAVSDSYDSGAGWVRDYASGADREALNIVVVGMAVSDSYDSGVGWVRDYARDVILVMRADTCTNVVFSAEIRSAHLSTNASSTTDCDVYTAPCQTAEYHQTF
jgi:hypothetical protein